MVGGYGQNAARAQMQRRREGRREADSAVAVPVLSQAHGGKDDRQRCGGEDVIDRQLRAHAAPQRALPHLDVAARGPGHRLPGVVVERRHGNRFRLTASEVFGKTGDFSFFVFGQKSFEQPSQRRCLHEAVNARRDRRSSGDEPRAPGEHASRQRGGIDLDDVVEMESPPHVRQGLDSVGQRPAIRGEVERVDGTRRNAGDDVEPDTGKMASESSQHADLVGRARASARQHQRERIGLAGHAHLTLHGNPRRLHSPARAPAKQPDSP